MKALIHTYTSESVLDNPSYLYDIYSVLLESQEWYPEIFKWYFKKFVPNMINGKRHIIKYHVGSDMTGIALLKKEDNEKKICTFRVKSKYRRNGIGKRLFGKCVEILNTERPMITVSAERLCYFKNIFKYYDLKLEQVLEGYYRENSSEYVFNGYLDSKKIPFNKGRSEASEDKYTYFNQFLLENSKTMNDIV